MAIFTRWKTALGALAVALAGCTAAADLAGYDSATMNAKAARNYTQVKSQAQAQHALDTSSATAQRVQRVFRRMRPFAEQMNRTGQPFDWEMVVIRSGEMNAWAMPGGRMAVYTGIVEKLDLSDDELAAVIGHEMVHALNEHSKQQVGQKVLTNIGMNVAVSAASKSTGISSQVLGTSANLLTELGIGLPFSRSHESEADLQGLRLMAYAGYNPQAAVSLWEKMNRASGGQQGIAFMSTHPSHSQRISDIRAALPQVMPIYEAAAKPRFAETPAKKRGTPARKR